MKVKHIVTTMLIIVSVIGLLLPIREDVRFIPYGAKNWMEIYSIFVYIPIILASVIGVIFLILLNWNKKIWK